MSLGLNRRILALAVMAGLQGTMGTALAGNPPLLTASKQASVIDAPRPSTTTSPDVSAYGYARGPGWTAAQVKRMSAKRRNRCRNKAANKAKGAR